jgi:hypothetical protein
VWPSFVTNAAIVSRDGPQLLFSCASQPLHCIVTQRPHTTTTTKTLHFLPSLRQSCKQALRCSKRDRSGSLLSCLSSSRYASALSHGESFFVLIQRAHLRVHCPSRTHTHHSSSRREPRRVSQPATVLSPLVSHRRSLRGDPFHTVSMHHAFAQNLVNCIVGVFTWFTIGYAFAYGSNYQAKDNTDSPTKSYRENCTHYLLFRMWPLDVSGGGGGGGGVCVCVCVCVCVRARVCVCVCDGWWGHPLQPRTTSLRGLRCRSARMLSHVPCHPPQNGSLAMVDTSCRTSTLANTPCGSTSSRSLQRRSRLYRVGLLDGLSSQPTSHPPCSCCLGYTLRSRTGFGRARLGSRTDRAGMATLILGTHDPLLPRR